MRIFYGPLFLAVTCPVLVCLRSTCVDFSSGRRLLDLFPCSALLGPTLNTCFFQFTEALVLGSCDRFSSCSHLFPCTAQCLVLSGICYASVHGAEEFHVFLRERWITDPEVDSRLSDSHLFVASLEEYMIRIFWEMTSGIISICSALGSTVDTCMASVYEVMASFTFFLRERELGS